MPRGVPASGQRRSIQQSAEPSIDSPDPTVADHDTGDVLGETADVPADAPVVPAAGPGPAADELTPEQREIKILRDRLAVSEGRKDVDPEPDELITQGSTDNIVIHFLEDGMTALGKVWYRGDELEFAPDSQAYKDTFDRRGKSWLDLRHDEFAQADRWGRIMFRNGPWPGKTYKDGQYEPMRSDRDSTKSLRPPTEDELIAAEKARQRRAAPRLPAVV